MSTFTFDLNSLQASGTSLERGLSGNTPDDKLTYSGNDPIVWDRVNNERLRRGLSPLPNPRPVDDGRTFNTGRGGAQSTTPTRQATPEERAEGERLARKFGLINNPDQTSSTFEVSGPPNMTREQAFAIFQKQASAGGLTGFQPGDIVSAQTQAADGLAAAQAELTQGFAGFPGTDRGVQNQFVSIAESAKQSLAAGNTGNLQSRITNGGTILQQTSAKIGSLFGAPVTNGINTADFAKTATAVMPMAGLSTTDVRATMASVGAATGQNFDQITNVVGVGKFGFNAPQLETAGLLKPGTASTFLNQGSNDLTSVLKSPAVWTGAGGITGLDSFLTNPAAQNLTQQNLMSSGLATASSLGVPLDGFNPKELGGISSVFAKDSAAGTDWIRGQLPPDKQADFDAKFKEAQFAIGTADEKLNDAMLQEAPPGEATDTVNRETVSAALGRVFGNDKIPAIDYNDTTPRLPSNLFAEQQAIVRLLKDQQKKFDEINATDTTASNADAKIAQLSEIIKKLNDVAKRAQVQKTDIANLPNPVPDAAREIDELLSTILALIDDIRTLYLPNLRRIKGG
jgi:hypothetical protein